MKAKITGKEIGNQLGLFSGMWHGSGELHYTLDEKTKYSLDVTPAPVEVPKMLADWLEEYSEKKSAYTLVELAYAANYNCDADKDMTIELIDWLKSNNNYCLATQAILYGYTIKPAQKWFVKVPHTECGLPFRDESFNIYYKDMSGATKASVQRFSKDDLSTEYPDTQFFEEELKKYHLDGDDVERIEAEQ